jgi:hypothetical protein
MEQVYFSNNATTSLTTDGGTTISVSSKANFPTSFPFYLTLEDVSLNREIVKVTSSANTTTWNVTRAQEGTTQLSFPASSKVELRLTAGLLSQMVTSAIKADNALSDAMAIAIALG